MFRCISRALFLLSGIAILCASTSEANAQLSITAAGVAQGLSLTTFATGFPSDGNGVGPLGITFTSNGGVLVSDAPGNTRLFPSDTDGQNATTIPISQNYGTNNALGMAQVGGKIYMTQVGNKDVAQVNANGTFNQVVVTGFDHPVGIVANPSNGHLFVSDQFTRIYDVDPIAGTKTSFANVPADGLSLSPDGRILYGAGGNGHLLGFRVSTGALVFDSGFIPGGVDGTAAGAGLFSNYVFANTNSGTLYEINLTTLSQTLIATGGSRGDFVTVDSTNNTLLITQTDRIQRLNGATFTVPEPGAIALLLAGGMAGMGLFLRRRGANRVA